MKKLIPILLMVVLASCTDTEIVSGRYEGTFYGTDTVSATMVESRLTEHNVRMDVTNSLNESFMEIGGLIENAENDYTIIHSNDVGSATVTGFYKDGYIEFTTTFNNYTFKGNQK